MNELDELDELELEEYCESELLSEEGLRELFERLELTPSNHREGCYYQFFYDACRNERVNEGIIRLILEYFPGVARANFEGWTPLHAACDSKGMTLNIIKLLIDEYPDSVRSVYDMDGYMPLHYLCKNDGLDEATAIQILKLLISKHPEAVQHVDHDDCLPIHIAARWSKPPNFCRVLIEAYPGSERIANDNGELPLHRACMSHNVAKVKYFYKLYPDAINHATDHGKSPIYCVISSFDRSDNPTGAVDIVKFLLDCDPNVKLQILGGAVLHFACQLKCNDSNIEAALEIIQLIYDEYPESISVEDSGGRLPLHHCCKVGGQYERGALHILRLLLEKHPEGVRHADRQGRLPIHYAAGSRSPEFCRVLIEANPGSQRIADANGLLPLHVACRYNTVATVKCLHKLYPDAINHATTDGHYPIHYAMEPVGDRNKLTGAVDIVQYLLDCDPNVKFQKFKGKSLLHFACQLKCNDSNIEAALEIIQLIYDEYPESISVEDSGGHLPLHHCCKVGGQYERGALHILRLLLEKHPEGVRHADRQGRLPIHYAAGSRSPEFCRVLIEANPGSQRIADANGLLPLHVACRYNTVATVKCLHKLYPDAINHATTDGHYPIHYAMEPVGDRNKLTGAVDIVQYLLDCDPNVKFQKFKGKSLLHFACQLKCNDSNIEAALEIIQLIYDEYPESISVEDSGGHLPLHHCCKVGGQYERGALHILRLLLEKHPEGVRHADRQGRLPIHYAAGSRSPEFCRVLIEANPGSQRIADANGLLPLHVACRYNTVATVKCLHKLYPDAINHATTDGHYPIHYAMEPVGDRNKLTGAVDIVQYLLDCDPNVKFQKFKGKSLLHFACQLKCNDSNIEAALEIIQLIYDEYPESISVEDSGGHLPLHHCCKVGGQYERGALHILRLLLEKHPEGVRHADRQGRLPIHYAAGSRSPEFCRVLIEANPGSQRIADANGLLPLHVACRYNTVATVKCLHKLYPDAINHATTDGHYPIHYAMEPVGDRNKLTGAVDIVQYLLDCDPNVKFQKFKGKSLLHFACQLKCNDSNIEAALEIIQLICDEYPESISVEDSGGRLPLHHCCKVGGQYERGALHILRLLLEKHPEGVRHADRQGRLPIHYVAGSRSPEFCRVLIEANPGSQRIADANGLLPLHVACRYNSFAAVEYFYKLYPDAINHTTTKGCYPIHYAMKRVGNRTKLTGVVEIVQYLLDCDPNVKFQKFEGASLLHNACLLTGHPGFNDSCIDTVLAIIKTVYDAHPEAIKDKRFVRDTRRYHQQARSFIISELVYARQAKDRSLMTTSDDNGRLPLHTALQNNVRLGSIKLLVKGNPNAVQSPDSSGALPVHIACQHHDSASVVKYLVELNTSALEAVDREGNTALHYACRGARHEIIALLLDEFGAVSVSKRNADKKLPFDVLWESDANRERVEYTESVYRLLRAYPEMMMGVDVKVQSAPASSSTLTGRKRKLGD